MGILKLPPEVYRSCQIWLLIDRTRYTWEIITTNSLCLRSASLVSTAVAVLVQNHPDTALAKARVDIDRELAVTQIVEVVEWV